MSYRQEWSEGPDHDEDALTPEEEARHAAILAETRARVWAQMDADIKAMEDDDTAPDGLPW